ncbi:predicted protein [Scheffersomyces stipitis CBS 6054]|uniref:Uncharacterized protein n=1 Tax=Scheffersomyces stipitis (strain ATCC 58785 / CBS 6054 / NBRC 10063 / NRRL Y-11545) TaxID=322104 RepID=A3LUG1_PICST|nr:predicted protein [Scheffersomyces stipitis CBS 6054]ABN66583.1 predicted protein [Scheffersomyces stipitis CBS 6054]KAG2733373.1 hypothetical protein G9P44_004363 [Scheffersomyces stipitis]
MFGAIRATQRNRVTNSLFSSTFAICCLMVAGNSLVPCPVDCVHGNDSIIDERYRQKLPEKAVGDQK